MKKWLNRHRGRFLIAMLSAFIFYVAEGESSGGQTFKVETEIKIE